MSEILHLIMDTILFPLGLLMIWHWIFYDFKIKQRKKPKI